MRPCSLAKASPSSLLTSLLASRSLPTFTSKSGWWGTRLTSYSQWAWWPCCCCCAAWRPPARWSGGWRCPAWWCRTPARPQPLPGSKIWWWTWRLPGQPSNERSAEAAAQHMALTVSHIWSLICLPSMLIIRAPNSTPIVRSWTGWNLLSVNWRRRQDLPTPVKGNRNLVIHFITISLFLTCVSDDDVLEKVSVRHVS